MKVKKVLIIGGSGFLGSSVVDEFIKKKMNVTVLDKKKPHLKSSYLKFIHSDISNEKEIQNQIKKNKLIYYFADIADINEGKKNPFNTIDNNIINLIKILKACGKFKIDNFIYGSSLYVYSVSGSFYRGSKQIAEILIKEFANNYKFKYQFYRYGSLYGKRSQQWNGINKFINQILKKNSIVYSGTGQEIREYINVSDASKMTVNNSLKNINKNGTYIVSGTQQYTVDQLFNILFEIAGKKKKVKYLKKISDDHYGLTPFRFIPEKSEKIILNEFTDLGEGLLEAFHENFKKR